MVQWISRLSSKQEVMYRIESHCGQGFFILKLSLVSRAAQHDYAIANKINRGKNLANTRI